MRTFHKSLSVLFGAGSLIFFAGPASARPPMIRMGVPNAALMRAPSVRTTPMVVPRVRMSSTSNARFTSPRPPFVSPTVSTTLSSRMPRFNEPTPQTAGAVSMQNNGRNFMFFPGTNPFFFTTGSMSPTQQFMMLEQAALNFSMNTGASAFPSMNSLLPPGIGSILPPGFGPTMMTLPTLPFMNSIPPIISPFDLGTFSTSTNPLLLGSAGFAGLNPAASFITPNMSLLGSSGMNAMPTMALASLSSGSMTSPATMPFVVAMNYDAILTPDQEKEFMRKLALVKSQSGASSTTVWAASDLNALLDDLKEHPNWAGREVPLSEAVMKHINIVPAKSYANAGLLKNDRRWPEILKRDEFQAERDQIEALIPKLVNQAKEGAVNTEDLQSLDDTVKTIRDHLAVLIQEVPDPVYIKAKRFLTDLQSGVKVLRQPDAAGYFSNLYAPKVKNMRELVSYMTKNDLRFAPATSGDEAAYLVFYRALANYDVSANLQQGTTATTQVALAK
jgi:hypothetical protein